MRIRMIDEETMLLSVVTHTSVFCHLEVEKVDHVSCESIWASCSKVIMNPKLIRNILELSPNLLCLIYLNNFNNDCCSGKQTLYSLSNITRRFT